MQKIEQSAIFSAYIEKFKALKIVFDNLPEDVVAILDADKNIAAANKAFSKMLQLPLENILGQKAAGILGMHRSSLWRKMRGYRIDKGFGKDRQR